MALPALPAGLLRCPVCLQLFQDPVSIPCGHNFCRACIERCWQSCRTSFPCPLCRRVSAESGLRPSRELGQIAAAARGSVAADFCGKHREMFRFFCREERVLLCGQCRIDGFHRFHRVVPAEEAAEEFKEQIQNSLQASKEEREKYLESQKSGKIRSLHLDKARSEGQRIIREFREFQQFLEEQRRFLLAQLGQLDGAIGRARDGALGRVAEELSELDTLIWEMEGKVQQPPGQFLREIQKHLDSCEMMKFQPPAEISSDLERNLEDFVQRSIVVRNTLRRCQDSLMFQLQEPADLTLDPSTAHPNLRLSEDGRAARGHLLPGDIQDNPRRFDFEPCVLAREGFLSGRHFWEVEVGRGGVWGLGVMREGARRRGPLSLTPSEGFWALEAFHSLTSPRARLPLLAAPRRVRVALDYQAGRVAFFGPAGDIPILEYSRAAFRGEKILPWFKLGIGARLREVAPRGDREVALGRDREVALGRDREVTADREVALGGDREVALGRDREVTADREVALGGDREVALGGDREVAADREVALGGDREVAAQVMSPLDWMGFGCSLRICR